MKALTGAKLIDGTGGPALQDATVLIDGERITAVGPGAAPSGASLSYHRVLR